MLAAMSQISSVASGVAGVLSGPGGMGSGIQGLAGKPGTMETPFSDLLSNAVGEVGRLENEAQKAVTGLMTGSGVDVHQAMIATEKASMAFELSLSVRNKAVQAYQQVMGMQF